MEGGVWRVGCGGQHMVKAVTHRAKDGRRLAFPKALGLVASCVQLK